MERNSHDFLIYNKNMIISNILDDLAIKCENAIQSMDLVKIDIAITSTEEFENKYTKDINAQIYSKYFLGNLHSTKAKVLKENSFSYIVPSEQSSIKAHTPIGWAEAHRIPTMGDINKAIPESQYRKENQSFLNLNNLKNLNPQKLQNSRVNNEIIQRMTRDGVFNHQLSNNDLLNLYAMYLLKY